MTSTTPRIAVITGAGSGIGLSIARRLDSCGFNTVLAGRTLEPLQMLAASLTNRALVVPTDISEPEQCHALIQHALSTFGRVDLLVNNAGGGSLHPLGQWTPALLLDTYRHNALGPAILVNDLWETFKAQHSGLVINITSMAVLDPFPGLGPYAAAKSALGSLTRTIHNEGASLGIVSYEIAPGAVETKLLRTIVNEDELPRSMALEPDAIAIVVEQIVNGERDEPSGSQIVVQKQG
jgi:NADP-dependent 3-hydroxy acid dehydrogenase YdfG